MPLNTNLRVLLEANGTIIGESEDVRICAVVLRLLDEDGGERSELLDALEDMRGRSEVGKVGGSQSAQLESLAEAIGVSVDALIGAMDPVLESPFIRINKRSWEAATRGMPSKGPGSVAPLALVMTLLAIWKEHARLGTATTREGTEVLRQLGLQDKNPSRSVSNCEWVRLRERGETFLNPAMVSKAYEFARAVCEKRAPRFEGAK